MADRKQLEDALIRAHEAGDYEGAQVLADEIKRLASAPPGAGALPPGGASWADTARDVMQSAGTGLVEGVAGLAQLPRDAGNYLGSWAGYGLNRAMGYSPEEATRLQNKASAKMQQLEQGALIPSPATVADKAVENFATYQPQTTAGEYARTAGQFAPNALAPVRGAATLAGKVATRVGSAVVPAAVSETAGQMTEGTKLYGVDLEPIARVAGAVIGGNIDPRAAKRPMAEMRNNAPTRAEVAGRSEQLYNALDNANVKFDPRAYNAFLTRLSNRLRNFRATKAPNSADSVDMLWQWQGKTPGFRDLEDMHQDISSIFREKGATYTDKKVAGILMEEFEKFYATAPVKIYNQSAGVTPRNVYDMVRQARDYGRRNILARQIDDMEGAQAGYLGGDESAMRNQFGAVLRSPQRKSLSDAEREAYKKVVSREGALALSHMAGSRLGQAGTIAAGLATAPLTGFLGPAIAGAGLVANLGARKGLEMYTKKAVDDARRTALAGRGAQNAAAAKAKVAKADSRIRKGGAAALAVGSPEVRGLLSDPFLFDANGVAYDENGNVIE